MKYCTSPLIAVDIHSYCWQKALELIYLVFFFFFGITKCVDVVNYNYLCTSNDSILLGLYILRIYI